MYDVKSQQWNVPSLFVGQIAVDNGFGGVYGQQKADWMVDVVQQYFHDNGGYV